LRLSSVLIDVAIVEVKGNQPCTLNGPWTDKEHQNVNRVLAAIGCLPHGVIDEAAARIYQCGIFEHEGYRIRLISVGRAGNPEIAERFPQVEQITWEQILSFIWSRFHKYRRQKTQVQQWDRQGLLLKHLSDRISEPEDFISTALSRMG
jgi:hypothetical protein